MPIFPGKLDCNRSHSRLHTMRIILLIGLCFGAAIARAQSVASPPQYPEIGWLTDSTYCNPYFGIRLNLPAGFRTERIYLPVQPNGRHMLLAMHLLQVDRSADIFLSAFEDNAPDSALRAARSRQQDARAASLTAHGPKQVHVHEHPLYRLNVTNLNGGSDAENNYYLAMRGWVLHFAIISSEQDLAAPISSAIEHLEFLDSVPHPCAPAPMSNQLADGNITNSARPMSFTDMPAAIAGNATSSVSPEAPRIYYGPSLPTALVESTLREAPGNSIPAGEFTRGVFSDPEVGVRFHLPRGWQPMSADDAYGVTELMRDPVSDPDAGDRRRALFRTCSRVLFSAADPATELVPEVHPAIAIAAMPQGCVPDLVLPARTDDFSGAEDFGNLLARSLGAFLLHHGNIQELTSGRTLFQLDGALPYQAPGELLTRRFSLRVTATTSGPWLIFIYSIAANPAAQRELESRIFLTSHANAHSAAEPAVSNGQEEQASGR